MVGPSRPAYARPVSASAACWRSRAAVARTRGKLGLLPRGPARPAPRPRSGVRPPSQLVQDLVAHARLRGLRAPRVPCARCLPPRSERRRRRPRQTATWARDSALTCAASVARDGQIDEAPATFGGEAGGAPRLLPGAPEATEVGQRARLGPLVGRRRRPLGRAHLVARRQERQALGEALVDPGRDERVGVVSGDRRPGGGRETTDSVGRPQEGTRQVKAGQQARRLMRPLEGDVASGTRRGADAPDRSPPAGRSRWPPWQWQVTRSTGRCRRAAAGTLELQHRQLGPGQARTGLDGAAAPPPEVAPPRCPASAPSRKRSAPGGPPDSSRGPRGCGPDGRGSPAPAPGRAPPPPARRGPRVAPPRSGRPRRARRPSALAGQPGGLEDLRLIPPGIGAQGPARRPANDRTRGAVVSPGRRNRRPKRDAGAPTGALSARRCSSSAMRRRARVDSRRDRSDG